MTWPRHTAAFEEHTYADRLGGSNGDGAKRGMVTIPDLAPYENCKSDPENVSVASIYIYMGNCPLTQ
jgi:hypothetical protein